MKNWHVVLLALLLSMFSTLASAQQSFCAVWPLTSDQSGSVTPSNVATTPNETLSPGSNPVVQIFDYWNGQGQRLNAAGSNATWTAGSVNVLRYLNFKLKAAAGYQLTITNVSFDYGGNSGSNRITADVRYSTDTVSYPVFALGIPDYPAQTWTTFSKPVPNAVITAGQTFGDTFSLRIMPYAITSQAGASLSFAAHRNVRICGTAFRGSIRDARLVINKNTGASMVAGTYTFNLSCIGPGGPYTGANPITISLPGTGAASTTVPLGDTCTMTEAQPAGLWSPPTWSGNGVTGNGWSAQIAINGTSNTVTVTNNPVKPTIIKFQIIKSTGASVIAGTYTFSLSCNGPGGAYTPSPVTITLPGSGAGITGVPQGHTCSVTENQPSGSGWITPAWSGSGVTPSPANAWTTTVGPINAGASLKVVNQRIKVDNGGPR